MLATKTNPLEKGVRMYIAYVLGPEKILNLGARSLPPFENREGWATSVVWASPAATY
jgi:hypothetical protein